jgi:hypothetical protein
LLLSLIPPVAPLRPGIALPPHPNTPLGVHQVGQDVVDAGQVAFAFGTQPIEDLLGEADAHRPRFSRREKMKIAQCGAQRNPEVTFPRQPPSRRAGVNRFVHSVKRKSFRPNGAVHLLTRTRSQGFTLGYYRSLPTGGNALSPRADVACGVHQIGQNVVDAGEMAFAFGAQLIEHLRVEADAPCRLAPWRLAQPILSLKISLKLMLLLNLPRRERHGLNRFPSCPENDA